MVLLSVPIALLGTSSILYADDMVHSLNELATQNDFHLATSPVVEFDDDCTTSDNSSITGNLFTFTHKVIDDDNEIPDDGRYCWGVSDSGVVKILNFSNTATEDKPGKISGTFEINRAWYYETPVPEDTILVSFRAVAHYVPPITDETEGDLPNYNFRGSFRITGGTGMYKGIKGSGTIAGTFQDHQYGDFDRAIEFVMMGKAFAR
jgi:hypothetical protein